MIAVAAAVLGRRMAASCLVIDVLDALDPVDRSLVVCTREERLCLGDRVPAMGVVHLARDGARRSGRFQ